MMQRTSEDGLITGFGLLDCIVSENDVDAPGHRTRGDLRRIFLYSYPLPIGKLRLLHIELPLGFIHTLAVFACYWLFPKRMLVR